MDELKEIAHITIEQIKQSAISIRQMYSLTAATKKVDLDTLNALYNNLVYIKDYAANHSLDKVNPEFYFAEFVSDLEHACDSAVIAARYASEVVSETINPIIKRLVLLRRMGVNYDEDGFPKDYEDFYSFYRDECTYLALNYISEIWAGVEGFYNKGLELAIQCPYEIW